LRSTNLTGRGARGPDRVILRVGRRLFGLSQRGVRRGRVDERRPAEPQPLNCSISYLWTAPTFGPPFDLGCPVFRGRSQ